MEYYLPNHASMLSVDPLGICDSSEPVTQAELLRLVLMEVKRFVDGASAVNLAEAVERIVYSVRSQGDLDTSNLEKVIRTMKQDLRDTTTTRSSYLRAVQCIAENAQSLQDAFPLAKLSNLTKHGESCSLTSRQVDVLLSHQVLGCLARPPSNTWGLPDFTCWYASPPVYEEVCRWYIETILYHFAGGGYKDLQHTISFRIFSSSDMPSPTDCHESPRFDFSIILEERDPYDLDTATTSVPFVLVPANREPGPGPAATHEERLMSASPALSIASLITPSIPDNAAVVTSAMPVHATWTGHGRSARLVKHIAPEKRPLRRYILADALPLDEMDDNPDHGPRDLAEGIVQREVRKLFAALSGAATMVAEAGEVDCYVEAGAWGCGAFGGTFVVKAVCMLIAAAMTKVQLTIRVLESRRNDTVLVTKLVQQAKTGAGLWQLAVGQELANILSRN